MQAVKETKASNELADLFLDVKKLSKAMEQAELEWQAKKDEFYDRFHQESGVPSDDHVVYCDEEKAFFSHPSEKFGLGVKFAKEFGLTTKESVEVVGRALLEGEQNAEN